MRREDLLGAGRGERMAVAAFAAAFVALLALMPVWRADDRPAGEAMTPAAFAAWESDFAARYETGGVARPPPGDVPVLARRFTFVPALELRVGQTYRLAFSSADGVHSAAIAGREVLVVPGRVTVITLTPTRPGPLDLRCGEYCGLGHSRMRGRITVVP